MQPHGRQSTGLPRPWDSPGKSTGVGCHFLLQCVKSESEVAQSCPTLRDPMDCSLTRLLRPWDFPGKSTGVGCHFLLQEIFPTQGLNPGLPHCRQMLYHLSHQRSTWIIIKYWLLFPWFFNLQFFSFTMVWKWHTYNRRHSSYFEFWSFPDYWYAVWSSLLMLDRGRNHSSQ